MNDTPRKLGRYELVHRIAVGGMGEIYLARVRGTAGFEKSVIIKTILPHLAEEEEFVDKFLDEGRIVVNLTHGNIVPVFDMDEVDGEYFIAMEYVPGRDLRDIVKRLRDRGETMPPELAAYIISEVCEGLGYAHRKTDGDGQSLDIVHRDVSPSNVLLSTDGEVKIIDFGIARAADRRAKTVSGRIQGKCCYMSPEQASGEQIDHRSDIFSAGLVLYELLTTVRPFDADSDLKSLDLVRACEFDPPSVLEAEVPDGLDAIIDRALAREPDERYQEIDQMHVDLMDFLVSRGRAVTSGDVAAFLDDLFPEGAERDAFQEARETKAEPEESMGLDEALNYELDRLDEESSEAESTSDDEIDPLERTLPDPSGGKTPRVGPGGGRTETLTPETGLSSRDGGRTVDEMPPKSQSRRADEQTTADQNRAETAEADSERAAPKVALWLLGIGVVAASVAAWVFSQPQRGSLTVRTDPSGASIAVDGDELDGARTPHEFKLDRGAHVLELTKKGFENKEVPVEIEGDLRETLTVELEPEEEEPREETSKKRSFRLRTRPAKATLRVNQSDIGEAPQTITVAPGETKFVEAQKEGCQRAQMPVFHGRENDVVTIHLECKDADAGSEEEQKKSDDETAPGSSASATPRPPARVDLTIRTTPSGASVVVDGEKLGAAPVTETFAADDEISVQLQKSGHESMTFTVTPGEVEEGELSKRLAEKQPGCLNFFAVHPQYNEIAIDGQWLEGRRSKLEGYELPPGEHRIRVRNPDAGKDETFDFSVEAGKECTSLTVWDPDDG